MAIEAYECTLSGTLAGQFVQTVFHAKVNNTGNLPSFLIAGQLADQLIAADEFVIKFLAGLPESYEATSLRVRRVGPSGGPTAIRLRGAFASFVGDRAAEISSAQVNPLIIFIPTTTPAKTGRIFMPGVAEADIDAMVLSSAVLGFYQDFIDYLKNGTSIAGGGVEFGTYRRATKVVDVIADGYVSPLIGTQRRRLRPV